MNAQILFHTLKAAPLQGMIVWPIVHGWQNWVKFGAHSTEPELLGTRLSQPSERSTNASALKSPGSFICY
jgi:hypothetical protein